MYPSSDSTAVRCSSHEAKRFAGAAHFGYQLAVPFYDYVTYTALEAEGVVTTGDVSDYGVARSMGGVFGRVCWGSWTRSTATVRM